MASYAFYAAWDWRFLSLIAFSTLIDFVAGKRIASARYQRARRRWLAVSIVSNLSLLGFFKYFNFFAVEFQQLALVFGIELNWTTLNIVLPVGISFFTFQTMSYTLDIYQGRLKPESSLLKYATYVAFFPQLVAGPIERARNLLPQFQIVQQFTWSAFQQGISLIIFGLFLKVVIADSLAPMVDQIFNTVPERNGGELALGAVFFACQIYGDFCGYSTIAIGVARIMGFQLMTNFSTPYFSLSLKDFWRNWHVSLSSFFRDYVYVPLGGSRSGPLRTIRNIMISFVLSGLWHGANWTFILWGALHGTGLVFSNLLTGRMLWLSGHLRSFTGWASTMIIVLVGWVLFRSPDVGAAMEYLLSVVSNPAMPTRHLEGLYYVVLVGVIDWLWRRDVRLEFGVFKGPDNGVARHLANSLLLALMFCTLLFYFVWNGGSNAFIYFQF
ncbi:MAG: MBOAT family O-acyltransferase [Pseudomonadota bacterium]